LGNLNSAAGALKAAARDRGRRRERDRLFIGALLGRAGESQSEFTGWERWRLAD
jgi:hypothetical protein